MALTQRLARALTRVDINQRISLLRTLQTTTKAVSPKAVQGTKNSDEVHQTSFQASLLNPSVPIGICASFGLRNKGGTYK